MSDPLRRLVARLRGRKRRRDRHAWHAAYPALAVDHMAEPPSYYQLAIPEYVEWTTRGRDELVIRDQRTGLLRARRRVVVVPFGDETERHRRDGQRDSASCHMSVRVS